MSKTMKVLLGVMVTLIACFILVPKFAGKTTSEIDRENKRNQILKERAKIYKPPVVKQPKPIPIPVGEQYTKFIYNSKFPDRQEVIGPTINKLLTNVKWSYNIAMYDTYDIIATGKLIETIAYVRPSNDRETENHFYVKQGAKVTFKFNIIDDIYELNQIEATCNIYNTGVVLLNNLQGKETNPPNTDIKFQDNAMNEVLKILLNDKTITVQ